MSWEATMERKLAEVEAVRERMAAGTTAGSAAGTTAGSKLISDEYRQQQREYHEKNSHSYGAVSTQFGPMVDGLINQLGIRKVLDYGAGKGRLAQVLRPQHKVEIYHYEPANPEWAASPDPAELVCCLDVLEHVEPEFIEAVLDDLQRVTERYGLFSVCCKPANKHLPDGRNAHLIVEPPTWWLPKIMSRFELRTYQIRRGGFCVFVANLACDSLSSDTDLPP